MVSISEENVVLDLCILFFSCVLFVLGYFYKSYQYWDKKRVPTIPPKFLLGNTTDFLPKGFAIGLLNKTFYDHFKQRGEKFGGVYLTSQPNLVLIDPDLIKDVLCKNFNCFVDRGFYFNQKHDPISANLFTMDGHQWRSLRQKFTPTFTSSKMRMMLRTMVECSSYMVDFLQNQKDEDLDIRDVAGKFTTDVIGSCAFGIECNSFKYPDAEFRMMGKKIFYFDLWRSIRAFFIINSPKLARFLGLTSNNKDVRDFFMKTLQQSLKLRDNDQFRRNDFLQILIDLQKTENLSFDEITAQVFLFFLAGFETSSTAISFALYEIANNEKIQNKLREEVCRVLDKHEEFSYEALGEMIYLKQVLEETLRKWPSGLTLNRKCTKEYNIPGTNVILEKGTPVLVSILGLHRDPENYPNPEIFDPDRFSEDQKANRHPCTYLPFGDGPRNCIGLRFGFMQSRVAVATIIKNFKIRVSPSTKEIKIDPHRFLLSSIDPIFLKLEKL